MSPKPDLTPYLGQTVTVRVDRPLGSRHPRFPEMVYPVNYGEVPGTRGGDGLPLDAYLLGWTAPIVQATGQVIAVVLRHNDHEDKLVVARPGTVWTAQQILEHIHFQEQFFVVSLRM